MKPYRLCILTGRLCHIINNVHKLPAGIENSKRYRCNLF